VLNPEKKEEKPRYRVNRQEINMVITGIFLHFLYIMRNRNISKFYRFLNRISDIP